MIDYRYMARVYAQKAVKQKVEEELKTITNIFLPKGVRRLIIERIEHCTDYDIQQKIRNSEMKDIKFIGYIEHFDKENDSWHKHYRLFSSSELGIYWEIINFYLIEERVYPGVL